MAVYQGGTVPRRPLLAMFRQIIANNRAGGWRKLKAGLRRVPGRPPIDRRPFARCDGAQLTA